VDDADGEALAVRLERRELYGRYARGGGGSGAVVRLRGAAASSATVATAAKAAGEKSLGVRTTAVAPHVTAAPQVAGAHGTSHRTGDGAESCAGATSDARDGAPGISWTTECV
jgi:hypothetical protein